ncbi:MAG: hypothetical protein ABIM21_07360 [candidate division WOR-3 bacterium]
MKKWRVVLLVGGLVIGLYVLTASAADISVSGAMRISGYSSRNVSTVPGDKKAEVDTRVQQDLELRVKASVSPDLFGTVVFTAEGFPEGWGTYGNGYGHMTFYDGKQPAGIKAAYLTFKIPGMTTPVWTDVGMIEVSRLVRVVPKGESPGLQFRSSCELQGGTLSWVLGWNKKADKEYAVEPPPQENKMKDILWATGADAKLGFLADPTEYPVSIDYYYTAVSYAMKQGLTLGAHFSIERADFLSNPTFKDSSMWWLGAYALGKVGPVQVEADVVHNNGKLNRTDKDVKYSGWYLRGVLTYPFEKYSVGLGGLYVSGNDQKKLNDEYKLNKFTPPYGGGNAGPLADSLIVVGGWNTAFSPVGDPGWTGGPMGYQGYWGLRLFGTYKVTDWLTLMGQVAYFGDNTKHGDIFYKGKDHDDIGWEVDLVAGINLYKNLMLRTGFGYLFAGNAAKNASGQDLKDPYLFVTTLFFTF